jgi:hypothetical protein
MALFISSKIHQGDDDLFSVQSRGKQCAFIISAVLTAQNGCRTDRLVKNNIDLLNTRRQNVLASSG